jgi:hypothetical protein
LTCSFLSLTLLESVGKKLQAILTQSARDSQGTQRDAPLLTVTIVGDSATHGPWCDRRKSRDSRSMDTVVLADRMFVNIASYFFGFIAFFVVSCLLLLGGVRLMSEASIHPEK